MQSDLTQKPCIAKSQNCKQYFSTFFFLATPLDLWDRSTAGTEVGLGCPEPAWQERRGRGWNGVVDSWALEKVIHGQVPTLSPPRVLGPWGGEVWGPPVDGSQEA